MANSPLIHLDRYRCANFAGVVTVKLVVPDDVQSYSSTTAEAGIVVKPGKTIYHLEIDPGTGGHRETLRDSDQGESHEQRIFFDVRKLRQEVVELRRRLMHRRVHVIFTDENGLTYLYLFMRLRIAEADNPARGKNGTRLEFRGKTVAPSPFVIGRLLTGTVEGGNVGDEEDDTVNEAPPVDEGGTPGQGLDGDLGDGSGGTPDDGDPGTGDPDPPTDPSDIRFEQPSTGKMFSIIIGACGEVITVEDP